MAGSYRVKRGVLSSGERMDCVVGRDGMPLPDITLYMLCELRTRSLATHTIVNSLRALQLFQIFLDARQINLRERLGKGRILQSFEVEALVQACKLSMPSQAATPGTGDPCMSDTPPL